MVTCGREIDTVADIVRVHAAQRPDAIALVSASARSPSPSSTRAPTVRPTRSGRPGRFGDRVAFIEKNGAEFFEVTFGLAKLGAVGVAVNWRLAAPEMLQIIEDADAGVIVVGSEFFGHIEAVEDQFTRVHTIVAIGEHDRWPSFDDWIAGHPADDPGRHRSRRHRRAALHLGHHRPAQGRAC